MNIYTCEDKCCEVKVRKEFPKNPPKRLRRGRCYKAGVFVYDPGTCSVLLVQSRGHLWGPPKGTVEVEREETMWDCAIRELKEETGIEADLEELRDSVMIGEKAMFYYIERSKEKIDPPPPMITETGEVNDVNGITWINVDCLEKLVVNGNIVLNQHAVLLLYHYLRRILPKSDFVPVKGKRGR